MIFRDVFWARNNNLIVDPVANSMKDRLGDVGQENYILENQSCKRTMILTVLFLSGMSLNSLKAISKQDNADGEEALGFSATDPSTI